MLQVIPATTPPEMTDTWFRGADLLPNSTIGSLAIMVGLFILILVLVPFAKSLQERLSKFNLRKILVWVGSIALLVWLVDHFGLIALAQSYLK